MIANHTVLAYYAEARRLEDLLPRRSRPSRATGGRLAGALARIVAAVRRPAARTSALGTGAGIGPAAGQPSA